ncbi:hypothetical protein [Thermogymnomonas acidicola]|uniref:hypothetical protein n=1 Tax=Thermogymnomonas acidicola TaxID=399579 RepID=UPI001396BE7B|nr:hypothetical protein [Thermogymnomonas acidicola]
MRAADTGRRVVLLRTCPPILMADAGPPMAVLLPLFRRGLGGYVRPGNQCSHGYTSPMKWRPYAS